MSRKFVCQVCRGKDTDDKMIKIKVGKVNKRYHKLNCYDEYLADLEFKKQEKVELDELVETIKKVHEIEIIPNQFFSFLQDLRNGNEMFGRVGQKRSKGGYSYKIISETYKHHTQEINWARNNVDFRGDTFNLLKYTLAIIKKKIAGVSEIVKRKEQQDEIAKEQELNQSYDFGFDTHNYKEKKDEQDISDML